MFESLENRQFMSATSFTHAAQSAPRLVTPPIVMAAGETPGQQAQNVARPNENFGVTPEKVADQVSRPIPHL
jgi:hypothetical protein